jgi:hypothetical protein
MKYSVLGRNISFDTLIDDYKFKLRECAVTDLSLAPSSLLIFQACAERFSYNSLIKDIMTYLNSAPLPTLACESCCGYPSCACWFPTPDSPYYCIFEPPDTMPDPAMAVGLISLALLLALELGFSSFLCCKIALA